MYRKRLVPGVRPGPTGAEVLKMYAISRLMLNRAGSPTFKSHGSKKGLVLPRFA